ncbi:MAG: hypothetical protein JWQ81_1026 [Amycolatopsis sp.]|nr:hypothetical protein [Amycolatopsis sp.]
MTRLRWISGILWVWSWYTVYLEVFRWRHLTRTLRLNPPPPLPGTDVAPRAGLPLQALRICALTAPAVFAAASVVASSRARMPHATDTQSVRKSAPQRPEAR